MTVDRLAERSLLLWGWGVTNAAVAAALTARGRRVVVADDRPTPDKLAEAAALGLGIETPASRDEIAWLVADVDAFVPAPGLPESHPVFAAAQGAGVALVSEFDLAQAFDDRPFVSVTGTNGKTTVVTLVVEMLEASGVRSLAVGNTEIPFVEAIGRDDVSVFVVEASSFRLAQTRRFLPAAAAWLNFAPDHLDVHRSMLHYEAAKARSWRDLGPAQMAVANAEDPIVSGYIETGEATYVTFGLSPDSARPTIGHYSVVDGRLVTPEGDTLIAVHDMARNLPHDIANALAAAALARTVGATPEGIASALTHFSGLAHRVQTIATVDGVRYVDDSKATAPHAVRAAVESFESVVLIAGGRNKGLDLSELATLRDRVRAVVGIGESGPEVVSVLRPRPGRSVSSMREAVEAAKGFAQPGDVVLLSPGCASFDQYENYAERGDDFVAAVAAVTATAGEPR